MSHYTSGDFFNIIPSYILKEEKEEAMSDYTDKFKVIVEGLKTVDAMAATVGISDEQITDLDYTVHELFMDVIDDLENHIRKQAEGR